ncbi:Catalase1 [Ramazzottius varieornatus]|uniref:Catalase n=1 Tax=Ramazzottius varieornatus TaxID=947166 RepID=A0A1D1UTC2_RAMVA|nr:Catalase1 [Ramazzottius varieornatus]
MATSWIFLSCLYAILTVSHGEMFIDTGHKEQASSPSCSVSDVDGLCDNAKVASLEGFRERKSEQDIMTTNQGIKVVDDDNSEKAGERGPTLMEDFIFREKMTHFDHERIPERVVHARGSAAHGYFQVYKSLANITKANLFQDPTKKTPVFVRFSTAQGFRGSADTVRDVRGFAVKLYTDEGVFDIVGNNMPVFFIQDSHKFPDIVHALKPEPHNEIPQASSAHDTFWDFVTQQTETQHMVIWLMSDRALPRAYANMEGFGVHTFRLVDAKGISRFVKFHWKPVLGVHSLVWDEVQKIAGKHPDFNRQQLYDDIENGKYPEWELGLQVVEEADEHKFDFDLLDSTKLIPEELVPVQRVGKLVLNRNPDSYFAEVEQVAFHSANIVPGIDFTNDPLLQGRLFSYLDTQLSRLGGPNFHEIPINQPTCPFRKNNQRDGFHRQTINVGRTSYSVNGINNNLPQPAARNRGFVSIQERVDGHKIRKRSPSFADHFSQATLFWKSMSTPEQDHIVQAYSFELSKVGHVFIRQRLVDQLQNVDATLALRVATNLGLKLSDKADNGFPKTDVKPSPALSQAYTAKDSLLTRKIAVLCADGVDGQAIRELNDTTTNAGAYMKIVSSRMGSLTTADGTEIPIDGTVLSLPSVLFDAVVVAGGADSIKTLQESGDALHYVLEAYVHYKPLAAVGEGVQFLQHIGILSKTKEAALPSGVLTSAQNRLSEDFKERFLSAIAQHRFFDRQRVSAIPA